MLKRLLFGALALAFIALAPQVHAAGQWPQARSQQIGSDGRPVVGMEACFFEGGTSTPLTTYSHPSLGEVNQNPACVESDGTGRFPPVFFDEADEFYRVRVRTASGTVVYDDDPVPIYGPPTSEGGGSEVPVSPDALLQTGDIKVKYSTGTISGFVRMNGRTIGSATSGASERANADTEDLFLYLCAIDNSTISSSSGNCATDWAANKTITLPDFRGRALVALDDMGNTAAGVLTGLTTLGETAGSEDYTLVAGDLPELTGTTSSNGQHGHPFRTGGNSDGVGNAGGLAQTTNDQVNHSAFASTTPTGTRGEQIGAAGAHTHTVTVNSGAADAISLVQPSMGVSIYIKL